MRVGLFGATGQVGGVMLRILEERSFPVEELRLFASSRSAGRTLAFQGRDLVVEDAASGFCGAVVSVGASISPSTNCFSTAACSALRWLTVARNGAASNVRD